MLSLKRVFLCLLSVLLLSGALPVPPAAAEELTGDASSVSGASSADASADETGSASGDAADEASEEEEQLRAAALYEESMDDDSFWDTFHDEFADDAEYVQWYNYYNGESSEEEEDLRVTDEEGLTAQSSTSSSLFTDYTYTHADSKDGMTIVNGIDVSKWQRTIDWEAVKAAGVDFVFIRCGYTGTVSRFSMAEDNMFAANIQGAYDAGIKVGVYYFSQALTTTEAQQEADKVYSTIKSYKSMISLPVVCDYEKANRIWPEDDEDSRISKTQGTQNVLAFCQRIASYGFNAYYYGNPDDLKTICDYTKMTAYGCWLARYNTVVDKFSGDYDFWQYTSSGTVDGISRSVDCNFWYKDESTLSTPTLSNAWCDKNGIKITWKAVSGAVKYRVFRRTEGGSWEKLADTASLSYTDESACVNTLYDYTVCCIDSEGTKCSSYNESGLSACRLSSPTLSGISGNSSKVRLTWGKVSGAVKYRVFRRTEGGSWKKLADTTSLSYSDSTVSVNVDYTYTVRCVSSDGKSYTSWYDSEGLSICCAETPTLSGIYNKSSGVKLRWASAKGAQLYKVFRKTSSGSWSTLGYTTSTSYTDKTAVNGTSYTYTVRCVSADKKRYTSSYNADGITYRFLSVPTLKSVSSSTSTSVTVKWSKNSKATGYQISYTTGSVTKTVYVSGSSTTAKTITGLKSGAAYTIKVRARRGSCYSARSSAKSVTLK